MEPAFSDGDLMYEGNYIGLPSASALRRSAYFPGSQGIWTSLVTALFAMLFLTAVMHSLRKFIPLLRDTKENDATFYPLPLTESCLLIYKAAGSSC